MPGVPVQFRPSRDSTSGEGRLFSRFFKRYVAVTTPTSWEDLKKEGGEGGWESRTVRHFAEKCRWHRHRRCLMRVRHLSHPQRALHGVYPDSAKSRRALARVPIKWNRLAVPFARKRVVRGASIKGIVRPADSSRSDY